MFSELQAKFQPIIDAAIESDMNYHGFDGTVASGFTGYSRATEANPLSEEVHVAPPGGADEGEATNDYGQVFTYDDYFFSMTFKPKEDVYDKWREAIPALFDPWLDIPDPDTLEPKVQAVRDAAKKLGLSVTTEGSGTDMSLVGGNQKLSGDLTYLNSEIGQFNGATINAFHQNYVSRMPTVISGQWSAACILGVGLAAQQDMWKRVRKDLLEIGDRMKEAMEEARGGGSGIGTDIKILGALASAATIFVSGPAAPIVGGIATSLGILGAFVPEGTGDTTHKELGGDWPVDVHDNVVVALDAMRTDIDTEEGAGRQCVSDARFEVFGNADFDLHRPTDLLGESDVGDLTTPDETLVKLGTLRSIGQSVMPGIAAELEAAVGLLDAASGNGPWTRTGGIGISYQGYYWEWEGLYENLTSIITDTAWEVRQGGEHLVIAAGLLEDSDELARKDLAAIQSELEAHAQRTADGSPISQTRTQEGMPIL